jgi:hypothetical protein
MIARLSRLLVMAILLGYFGYTLASWLIAWNPADAGAYYDAAHRLTSGQPLYPPMNPEAHEVYRYAPWFAVAWIPLTLLPREVATHLWSLAMLGCAVVAVWPLLRSPSWASVALAALAGQTLAETAMFGNVQPLVVATLVLAVGAASFPGWVGVTTSIKLVPLAFVLVWLPRREWRPAVTAIAVAAILWAPILLFDLTNYVTDPGTGLLSLYAVSPPLWFAVALASAGVVIWLAARHSAWAWVAATVFMVVGPPRVVTSYVAFIVVGYLLAARQRFPPDIVTRPRGAADADDA